MPPQVAEHEVRVGVLEVEGFDTGCVGAFCSTCSMWVGPHRDVGEEAEGDARRHSEAVRQQYRQATGHLAVTHSDQSESEIMNGLIEEDSESTPDFGPYFAYCDDCAGFVGLGRMTEEEAATEAQEHRRAFDAIRTAPPV